jgi:hypothetical protein
VKKMKYEKPVLIRFNVRGETGTGRCNPGSGDSGSCTDGIAASGKCQTGNSAAGLCRTNGNSPSGGCNTGVSP